ncbi:ribosome biogenesis factor YjgA [Luteibacter sp. RCC_6_2]|jgi:ribosome-associated protein|uniref:ribosome biogenesis factor YjgA n=1 Tax=Luteibacter sp. RCC_6_2 TaxID=3239223 RepID=UPI003526465B
MKPVDDRPHDGDEEDFGPSRSEKRRNALDILKLAGQLMELPPSRIPKLNLPDDIVEEIGRTRKITAHIARKRQLAFLAKQMRRHGDEAFTDARAALGEDRDRQRQEAAHMHRLEARRERLMEGGDVALGELFDQYPDLDRQHLRSLVRQAKAEREANKPLHAFRELYRILKELEAASPEE